MGNYLSGFCRISDQQIILNGKVVFAEQAKSLDDFLFNAYNNLEINYPKFFKMDNLSKAGFLASEVLLGANDPSEKYDAEEIAVILSNYSSSLDTDLKYHKSSKSVPSPALLVYTLPNIVTGEICIKNKFKGENAFFIQQEFNPKFLTSYVDTVLNTTNTKVCLAGWVEVLLEKHDVFLYLVEKTKSGDSIDHSPQELLDIYNRE